MTDHYAEAERLIAGWADMMQAIPDVPADFAAGHVTAEVIATIGQLAAAAQVHATLAAIPPYPKTAEDLRGAEAEIERLSSYDPCHGGEEQNARHNDVCVPWYEHRDGDNV